MILPHFGFRTFSSHPLRYLGGILDPSGLGLCDHKVPHITSHVVLSYTFFRFRLSKRVDPLALRAPRIL